MRGRCLVEFSRRPLVASVGPLLVRGWLLVKRGNVDAFIERTAHVAEVFKSGGQ